MLLIEADVVPSPSARGRKSVRSARLYLHAARSHCSTRTSSEGIVIGAIRFEDRSFDAPPCKSRHVRHDHFDRTLTDLLHLEEARRWLSAPSSNSCDSAPFATARSGHRKPVCYGSRRAACGCQSSIPLTDSCLLPGTSSIMRARADEACLRDTEIDAGESAREHVLDGACYIPWPR